MRGGGMSAARRSISLGRGCRHLPPRTGRPSALPFELLATDAGVSEVDSLLRRLQFGFYA